MNAKQGMNAILGAAVCLLGGPWTAGCEQEDLASLTARINVCPDSNPTGAMCNVGASLGDQPTGSSLALNLHVFNDGDGPLLIRNVTSHAPDLLSVVGYPEEVNERGKAMLNLELRPRDLGPTSVTLRVESSDPTRPSLDLTVDWTGIPLPVPRLVICPEGAGPEQCGAEVVIRLDGVRRERQGSQVVTVSNMGTAPLDIHAATWEGTTSAPGEISTGTSVGNGTIPRDASAQLLIIYAPADGESDDVTLVFQTNDPEHPSGRIRVIASSFDDRPPVAVAQLVVYDTVGGDAVVGEGVWVDGAASTDPQGDPIAFQWSLEKPADSLAMLEGATSAVAHFVPDVPGEYVATLVVRDSLGQESAPASVSLVARTRYALRTTLDWDSGGDVDIHLVSPGGTLFGDGDCHFGAPHPSWGSADTTNDDPWLRQDGETSPGHEEIVMVEPAPGVYALYAHYFDDYGRGPTTVRAKVILDEQAETASQRNMILSSECMLWHVADIQFPERIIIPATGGVTTRCY